MSKWSEYVDYLVTLDERVDHSDEWIDERIEMRFLWESDDMLFRNVQVLG